MICYLRDAAYVLHAINIDLRKIIIVRTLLHSISFPSRYFDASCILGSQTGPCPFFSPTRLCFVPFANPFPVPELRHSQSTDIAGQLLLPLRPFLRLDEVISVAINPFRRIWYALYIHGCLESLFSVKKITRYFVIDPTQ